MTGLVISLALVVVIAIAAVVLAVRAARRERAVTRRQLQLIANHIEAQQPPRKPELRVIRGGRR